MIFLICCTPVLLLARKRDGGVSGIGRNGEPRIFEGEALLNWGAGGGGEGEGEGVLGNEGGCILKVCFIQFVLYLTMAFFPKLFSWLNVLDVVCTLQYFSFVVFLFTFHFYFLFATRTQVSHPTFALSRTRIYSGTMSPITTKRRRPQSVGPTQPRRSWLISLASNIYTNKATDMLLRAIMRRYE